MIQPIDRVFISYRRTDGELVNPTIQALRDWGIPVYVDVTDNPAGDAHSLEVGLSEGLATSSMLLAFVSREYLRSRWCRGELREFIFLHGAKVENPEQQTAYGRNPSYKFYNRSIPLPRIPVLLVLLDASVSLKDVAEEVSPEDRMADFNYRVMAYRADTEPSRRIFCLDYVRRRGIDASNYVEDIQAYDGSVAQAEEIAAAVAGWFSTASPRRIEEMEESAKPEGVASLWARMCSEYAFSEFARTVDPLAVVDGVNPGPLATDDLRARICRYSDELLISLFADIRAGQRSATYFDRRAAEGFSPLPSYFHLLPKVPEDPYAVRRLLELVQRVMSREQLRPRLLQSHPLSLLVNLARQRELLRPLQYSYYAALENSGHNSSVYAAAVAGLFVNIDIWFKVIHKMETLHELIVEPLNELRDIRSLFRW